MWQAAIEVRQENCLNALELLERADQLRPAISKTLRELARATAKEIVAYLTEQSALEEDPLPTYALRGRAYQFLRYFDKARKDYERVLQKQRDPELVVRMAKIDITQQHAVKACKDLSRLLMDDPKHPEALFCSRSSLDAHQRNSKSRGRYSAGHPTG